MVVPAAYGEAGLRKVNLSLTLTLALTLTLTLTPTLTLAPTLTPTKVNVGIGKSRFTGLKAPLVIQSNAPAYFDIIMLDGGSGRCESLLRPPGVSEKDARKLKSMTCSSKYEIY